MGQRGAGATFMPSKYVFPGGAVDPDDHEDPAPGLVSDLCRARMSQFCDEAAPQPETLIRAALRELTEETGHRVKPPPFTHAPMRFVFRAITPPGRTRRFDARFLLIDATALETDPDDFSGASGEFSHLHWIGLGPARDLDLPFITEIVLAEIAGLLGGQDQPGVPFFDNSTDAPKFRRIV